MHQALVDAADAPDVCREAQADVRCRERSAIVCCPERDVAFASSGGSKAQADARCRERSATACSPERGVAIAAIGANRKAQQAPEAAMAAPGEGAAASKPFASVTGSDSALGGTATRDLSLVLANRHPEARGRAASGGGFSSGSEATDDSFNTFASRQRSLLKPKAFTATGWS